MVRVLSLRVRRRRNAYGGLPPAAVEPAAAYEHLPGVARMLQYASAKRRARSRSPGSRRRPARAVLRPPTSWRRRAAREIAGAAAADYRRCGARRKRPPAAKSARAVACRVGEAVSPRGMLANARQPSAEDAATTAWLPRRRRRAVTPAGHLIAAAPERHRTHRNRGAPHPPRRNTPKPLRRADGKLPARPPTRRRQLSRALPQCRCRRLRPEVWRAPRNCQGLPRAPHTGRAAQPSRAAPRVYTALHDAATTPAAACGAAPAEQPLRPPSGGRRAAESSASTQNRRAPLPPPRGSRAACFCGRLPPSDAATTGAGAGRRRWRRCSDSTAVRHAPIHSGSRLRPARRRPLRDKRPAAAQPGLGAKSV